MQAVQKLVHALSRKLVLTVKLQESGYPIGKMVFACVFESALLLVAFAAGWFAGTNPLATATADWGAAIAGLIAVAPLLALLWWGLGHPQGVMGKVTLQAQEFVIQFLGGIGLVGFALLSLLAGISEEALFRGVIQTSAALHSTEVAGLAIASLLFGLAHAVSRPYAIVATLIGAYLGVLYLCTGNIVAPIVCHAVYDFIALVWLVRAQPRQS